MLMFNAYISYEFVKSFSKSIEEKNEKLYEITQFQIYLSELKDAETGQRGYLITGNKSYLEPYEQGIKYINSSNSQAFLEKSEKQNDISKEIKELKKLTQLKIDELKNVIDMYNTLGFKAAQERISINIGKNFMDEIRVIVDNIISIKQKNLEVIDKKSNQHIGSIIEQIVSINIIYVILISLCLYIISRSIP